MSIPSHLPIPVHSSKYSETQVMWVDFGKFKKSFQHAMYHGYVWGCYLTKGGNIAYQDNNGKSFYNILKSK